jgi:hypothetical protein
MASFHRDSRHQHAQGFSIEILGLYSSGRRAGQSSDDNKVAHNYSLYLEVDITGSEATGVGDDNTQGGLVVCL